MKKMNDLRRVVELQRNAPHLTKDEILAELSVLTDPIFSARMMSKVSGLPLNVVLETMGKTAKTGGRLNPETLDVIWNLSEFGFVAEDVAWCVSMGTSETLLARLTGIPQSRIHRAYRRSLMN